MLVACGGSSSPTDMTTNLPDSAAVADLATAIGPDMAGYTCAQIFNCITACPPANLNTCVPGCISLGSATALMYFNPLQSCSAPACYAPVDGGAPTCSQPASMACASCVNTNCGAQASACLAH